MQRSWGTAGFLPAINLFSKGHVYTIQTVGNKKMRFLSFSHRKLLMDRIDENHQDGLNRFPHSIPD